MNFTVDRTVALWSKSAKISYLSKRFDLLARSHSEPAGQTRTGGARVSLAPP